MRAGSCHASAFSEPRPSRSARPIPPQTVRSPRVFGEAQVAIELKTPAFAPGLPQGANSGANLVDRRDEQQSCNTNKRQSEIPRRISTQVHAPLLSYSARRNASSAIQYN